MLSPCLTRAADLLRTCERSPVLSVFLRAILVLLRFRLFFALQLLALNKVTQDPTDGETKLLFSLRRSAPLRASGCC